MLYRVAQQQLLALQAAQKSNSVCARPLEAGAAKDKRKFLFYQAIFSTSDFQLDIPPYLRRPYSDLTRILTSFRCGFHPLQIELGARTNIARHQRVCRLCNSDVESEHHFMISCPSLSTTRLQSRFQSLPLDQPIEQLLSSSYFPLNATLLRELLKQRSSILPSDNN